MLYQLSYEAIRLEAGQFSELMCSREGRDEWNKCIYYTNTNEIPSELSRENMISSLVTREKITVAMVTYKNLAFREIV